MNEIYISCSNVEYYHNCCCHCCCCYCYVDLAQRVRDLNNRIADIRREQSYQRVSIIIIIIISKNI